MNLTTLEQSLKLKEWGAPQVTDFSWHRSTTVEEKIKEHADPNDPTYWETVYYLAPLHTHLEEKIAAYSLEELIEWLGKDFDEVRHHGDSFYSAHSLRTHPEHLYGEGNTPLEAVYNLCEALFGGKK